MFILNVTFKVAHPIREQWIPWCHRSWMPAWLPNPETRWQMTELMDATDEEGSTLAIQIYVADAPALEALEQQWEAAAQPMLQQQWGTAVLFFATRMRLVQ